MNNEKAQAYFQQIYKTHVPEKMMMKDGTWYWSECRGDHLVSGWEFDVDMNKDGLCYDYVLAADILGLPVMVLEKSPPRKPIPESEMSLTDKAWQEYTRNALVSFLHNQALSTINPSNTSTITFKIKK